MTWDDIPTAAKMSVYTVGVLVAVATFAFETFQTISAAEQQQQTQAQQFRAWRESDIDQQIAQYRYQLLSTQLTAAQREWILTEIRRLEELVRCIRAGQC